MSRLFTISLALLTLSSLAADSASAQEALDFSEPLRSETAPARARLSDAWSDEAPPTPAADHSGWPSTFQFSLSAGFGSSFSSLHEDLVASQGDEYEDIPDAFGVTGSLTLGGVAFHRVYGTGHQITLIPGYRASIDRYVLGLLDTGFIHRHEATLGIAINRRFVVGIGAGIAVAHSDGEVLAGGAIHLDMRIGFASGIFLGMPLNVSVLSGPADTVVVTTLAVEFGWQSLR